MKNEPTKHRPFTPLEQVENLDAVGMALCKVSNTMAMSMNDLPEDLDPRALRQIETTYKIFVSILSIIRIVRDDIAEQNKIGYESQINNPQLVADRAARALVNAAEVGDDWSPEDVGNA